MIMLADTDLYQQTSFLGTDLLYQFDLSDSLLLLSKEIPWTDFKRTFGRCYSDRSGRHSIPINLLVGLPILK
jgi:hypothetical protein